MVRGMRHVIGGAALVAGILLQATQSFAQMPPWAQQQRRYNSRTAASRRAFARAYRSVQLNDRGRSSRLSRSSGRSPSRRRRTSAERQACLKQGHAGQTR